jgi:hypothetical protein
MEGTMSRQSEGMPGRSLSPSRGAESELAESQYLDALACEDPAERTRRLKAVADAGYIPAMCDFALRCEEPQQRKRWLRDAAYEAYPPAMYYYGLDCDNSVTRKAWLKAAAEAGYGPAVRQMALECEDQAERNAWLEKTHGQMAESLPPVRAFDALVAAAAM